MDTVKHAVNKPMLCGFALLSLVSISTDGNVAYEIVAATEKEHRDDKTDRCTRDKNNKSCCRGVQ